MNKLLASAKIFDDALKVGFLSHIARSEWNDLSSSPVGRVSFGCVLEYFFATAGDVDFGSVSSERLGRHKTDPSATTSDYANPSFHGVQTVDIKVTR